MIKNKRFKKKEKKGVFRYEDYFEPYDVVETWRIPNQETPARVLYRWAKSRVRYFKKDQRSRRKKQAASKKLRKDGFFLTCLKFYISFFIYVLLPLCVILVCFNWFIFIRPLLAMDLVRFWSLTFPAFKFTYIDFVLFLHYYLSPIVITLKILVFPPIFISHLFIIWYVHINTKWNDYMERKLISIAVWRLGVGYIPASAEIINSWVFWGERFYVDFYKNVLITGPFFVINYIWKLFKISLEISYKTIISFMSNIFK
jgi:hypothetical protein